MALISTHELSIGYRGPPLLDHVSCQIERGHRVGLMGRNGAGKTTFLRLLAGDIQPDHGEVVIASGVNVAMLSQEIPGGVHGTIRSVVAASLPKPGDEDDWNLGHRVDQILSRMELDSEQRFEVLSSGMKRRVLLARTLVADPDVLLLDEPTNHLDLNAIHWLEQFLRRWEGTLIFVTHDRMFLRKMAERILEIDRGHLFDWSCGYDTFLNRKEAALEAEAKQNALFDKKLAQEETWIRQGIKARRTRNEGRVLALKEMRQMRSERQSAPGKIRLDIQASRRSGELVAEAKGLTFAYDDRVIIDTFSTTIVRGDKIGVIGPNGVGKSTLLRLLLGQLSPSEGSLRTGTNLDIAYFDQLRDQLDGEKTVSENVGDGYETVGVEGKSRHIIGYLQGFLFNPDRARTLVRFLSGGERNRVLLAKLFAKPANVIVLDEPTNDLDVETLELLESKLVDFGGTVLLVSHDREFLNNVVTSTIVFEQGLVREYVGGYDDWLRQRPTSDDPTIENASKVARSATIAPAGRRSGDTRRLSFKERQELDALPERIEQLETEVSRLHEVMAQAAFYQQTADFITTETTRLKDLEADLSTAYRRWEQLEQINEA